MNQQTDFLALHQKEEVKVVAQLQQDKKALPLGSQHLVPCMHLVLMSKHNQTLVS